jgi:hypothetical protein
MSIPKRLFRAPLIGILATGVIVSCVVVSCDVPTTGPSVNTETGLNAPVVVNKTFTFLGGPESQNEPLIDTTTSQFDSLFAVAGSDQSLSLEQEVSSFNVGSLDQALGEATEGVGINTSISETVIQESGLATQDIDVDQFREENGRAGPVPAPDPVSTPVGSAVRSFPAGLLAIPDFQVASVQADTVQQGTLTSEDFAEGKEVNRLTFTLRNAPVDPTPLTDGDGNGPTIRVENSAGDLVVSADFPAPVRAGETKEQTVSLAGKTLGKRSQLNLVVKGSDQDPDDELTLELSSLRYQEATLEDNLRVDVSATRTGLSTRNGSGSQFAGIETRSGTLQLDVTNNFQFPIQIDSLRLENNLQDTPALPDSFQALDALKRTGSIAPGATETLEVDLAGRGIARSIDVGVRGGLANERDVLTAAAEDNIEVSVAGSLTIGAMFFWPDGEVVQAGGTVDFNQDRISFDRPDHFVELDGGTLALSNLISEPDVAFDSFRLSFPDIRGNDYGPEDSLTIEFPVPAGENPEIEDESLSGLRLSPTQNTLDYHVRGTLETISNQTAEDLRIIRFADEVRTDVSVGDLDVRALETRVSPFSVNITEDANGDGRLDLADNAEATQESFEDLGDISGKVSDLNLEGSELSFRVRTDAGTDARLYAALQGRGGNDLTFLAGEEGSPKHVPLTAPLGDNFVRGNASIVRDSLVRFNVEGAPTNDPVTRSITLDGENSTVDEFLSTLPTSLRFVSRARLTGDDEGQMRLRRPLKFDASLGVTVPLKFNEGPTVEDTIDADFSSLEDVTDPEEDITVSSAKLQVKYANAVPLGAEATFVVLDENDEEVLTLPGENNAVAIQPAPKGENGTSSGARSGRTTLELSERQLQDLSGGRSLHLLLTMEQLQDGTAATLRATDTIDLSLEAKVEASVSANN